MADRYDHETLLAYVEGDLTDEARARFDAQLKEDPELRRLVEGLVRDRTVLRELPKEPPPPAMVDDAIQQLERQMLLGAPSDEPIPIELTKRPPRRHRVFKAMAYSGIAAIMLLSGGLIVLTLTGTNAIDTAQRIVQLDRSEETSAEREPLPDESPARSGDVAPNGEGVASPEAPMTLAERSPLGDADATGGRPADAADGPAAPESLSLSQPAPKLPEGVSDSLASRLRLNETFGVGDSWRMMDTETPGTDATVAEDVESMPPTQAARSADEALAQTDATLMRQPKVEAGNEAADASAAQPLRVTVMSDDVLRTQQTLTAWAANNRVAVRVPRGQVQPTRPAAGSHTLGADDEAMPTRRMRTAAADLDERLLLDAPVQVGQAEQVRRLRLEWRQLPELLMYLNRGDDRQRAELQVHAGSGRMPPSPVVWEELVGRSVIQPPLRRPTVAQAWVEVEVAIMPMGEGEPEVVDAVDAPAPDETDATDAIGD